MNSDNSVYYNIYLILRALFSFAVLFFLMSLGYLLCRGINNTECKEAIYLNT